MMPYTTPEVPAVAAISPPFNTFKENALYFFFQITPDYGIKISAEKESSVVFGLKISSG